MLFESYAGDSDVRSTRFSTSWPAGPPRMPRARPRRRRQPFLICLAAPKMISVRTYGFMAWALVLCAVPACSSGGAAPLAADGGTSADSASGASSTSSGSGPTGGSDSGSVDAGTADSGSSGGSGSSDGGDSGDADGCSPGLTQCFSSSAVQICGTTGLWGTPWPCATGTCSNGACAGSTTSGASCQTSGPGLSNCGGLPDAGGAGTAGGENCCTSQEVAGGTYNRTYTNSGDGPTDEADPATVSGFRLDKYMVTVGRFRQFVNAVLPADGGSGWVPLPGSGKHTHLNNGQGLAGDADAGAYEPGWVATDDSNVAPTDMSLACDTMGHNTWTSTVGGQENLPIVCLNWWEAYAFCIWDGGFLPSEAEWEYAAAGGGEEREYPWGSTDPGVLNQYAIYGCYYPSGIPICFGEATIAPVGTATLGAGRWGQLDLAGNAFEWNLDWSAPSFADPCTNCATLTESATRVIIGGSFSYPDDYLAPSDTYLAPPAAGNANTGFRCARTP